MDITVAICTYNGAEDVPEVLDHLHDQKKVDQIQWEVLVIDNNSTDSTESVVRRCQKNWEREAPIQYLFEGRQGKSYAMESAVVEARGEWIAFLDDDNLPAPDWVAAVHRFAQAHPQAGAFGGQIHGQFETEPPNSFGLVEGLFAIKERSEKVCYSAGRNMTFAAPGAGLVIRKKAWEKSVPEEGLSQKGTIKNDGGEFAEDMEVQWYLYEDGWEIWHNPDMHIEHKIPAERFEREYLKGFFKTHGFGRHRVRMIRLSPWQRPLWTVAYWGADLWKLARLAWIYRTRLFTDRFVQGRARMTLYMLAAPFMSN